MKQIILVIAMVVVGTTLKAKSETETSQKSNLTKEMVELLDQKPEGLSYKEACQILTGEKKEMIFAEKEVFMKKITPFTWRDIFKNPFVNEYGSIYSCASTSNQDWKITYEANYYGKHVDWKQVSSTSSMAVIVGLIVFILTRRSYKKRLEKFQ